MKVFAVFVAVLVASAGALDTPEFTYANRQLQNVQQSVVAQVITARNSIRQALYNEFGWLQNLAGTQLKTVSAFGNATLTADVTDVVNSIGTKIIATFNPTAIATSILAPYLAVFANWYKQVSTGIASLNTTNPPVSLACLKAEESSIKGNFTALATLARNDVTKQLSAINARFRTLNAAIKADLASITDIESSLPAVSAKADVYIQQNVAAFASDVATATTNAKALNAVFVTDREKALQDLTNCAAA